MFISKHLVWLDEQVLDWTIIHFHTLLKRAVKVLKRLCAVLLDPSLLAFYLFPKISLAMPQFIQLL